jgi:hypothetical protein
MSTINSNLKSRLLGWRRGAALPLAVGLGLLPLLAVVLWLGPGVALASPAGSGTVNAPCNEASFSSALAGGGAVTFNCGPNPVTITLSSQKTITLSTIIEGGSLGRVILSGNNITRLLVVTSGASLSLNNLVLRDGRVSAHDFGGAAVLVLHGQLAVAHSSFLNNTSYKVGGAVSVISGSLTSIADSYFAGNQSTDEYGGAVYSLVPFSINGTTFYSNSSQYGGAIYDDASLLTLTNSSLYENSALYSGGSMYLSHGARLTNVAIYSNTALSGDSWGAGVDDEASEPVWMDHVQIYGNTVFTGNANYAGAGMTVFYGALTLSNSSVYSNVALSGPGGGIHVSYGATLTVISSAIVGNQALAGPGGGIDLRSNGGVPALSIYNSTVADNSATTGGGLNTDNASIGVLSYTTFYNNQATAGKNISGTIEMADSIFAGGGSGNCVGAQKSFGYNLDDGNSCDLFAPGDLTATNPLVGPLAFNGGPTLTHALLPGSPAIDKASPTDCPATDQRGAARPIDGDHAGGARCDIGAFEFGAILPRLWLAVLER